MASPSATTGSAQPSAADRDQASLALTREDRLARWLRISERRRTVSEKCRALRRKRDALRDDAGKVEKLGLQIEEWENYREELDINRDEVGTFSIAYFLLVYLFNNRVAPA